MNPAGMTVLEHEDAEGRRWTTEQRSTYRATHKPSATELARRENQKRLHAAALKRRAKAKRGGKR